MGALWGAGLCLSGWIVCWGSRLKGLSTAPGCSHTRVAWLGASICALTECFKLSSKSYWMLECPAVETGLKSQWERAHRLRNINLKNGSLSSECINTAIRSLQLRWFVVVFNVGVSSRPSLGPQTGLHPSLCLLHTPPTPCWGTGAITQPWHDRRCTLSRTHCTRSGRSSWLLSSISPPTSSSAPSINPATLNRWVACVQNARKPQKGPIGGEWQLWWPFERAGCLSSKMSCVLFGQDLVFILH